MGSEVEVMKSPLRGKGIRKERDAASKRLSRAARRRAMALSTFDRTRLTRLLIDLRNGRRAPRPGVLSGSRIQNLLC
jgi:hypothetical protein